MKNLFEIARKKFISESSWKKLTKSHIRKVNQYDEGVRVKNIPIWSITML